MLNGFPDALRRLKVAALLDAMQAAHKLGGLDCLHGQRADPRKDVQLQVSHYLLGVAVGPLAVLPRLGLPGAGQYLEGVETGNKIALRLNSSLGTPLGTRKNGTLWDSTIPLEPPFHAKPLIYKDL